MSGDPEQEYFADGMVEDIITALSRVQVAVRDRAQLELYLQGQGRRHQAGRAGTRRSLRARRQRPQGRRPGAHHRPADRQRTGAHLWAGPIRRRNGGRLRSQDEVAEKVIAAIAPSIEQAKSTRSQKPTANLSAHDCYLRASASGGGQTGTVREEAMRLLKRALEIDPGIRRRWDCCWLSTPIEWHPALSVTPQAKMRRWNCSYARPVRIGRDDAIALGHTAYAIAYVLCAILLSRKSR